MTNSVDNLTLRPVAQRIAELESQFAALSSWDDRYRLIIQKGRALANLQEEQKSEQFRIKGCQSQVWLVPSFQQGLVVFAADSDALLVKGIISLLIEIYSQATPSEILDNKPDFFNKIGISDHLSMNRSNGLAAMIKQIQMYAFAYKALEQGAVKSE
jgi:cysteine desulfuration protein SufE